MGINVYCQFVLIIFFVYIILYLKNGVTLLFNKSKKQCVLGLRMHCSVHCAVLLSFCMPVYMMVCTECEEWPKEKRSEIMFSFFVSDMHSRKLQHRLNEKLWLVENYFRTHGTWRNNGPSQCSQNPSKSIDINISLTTSTEPTSPSSSSHYLHVMPTFTTRGHLRQKCACSSTALQAKVAPMCWHLGFSYWI